jgi:predicted secreted protein
MPINGTLVLVNAQGSAIASTTDATLNIEMDAPDASTKGSSGWAENIAGQKSWSIDVDGLATFDYSTGNVEKLVEYLTGQTLVAVRFLPDAGVAYYGDARMTSVSIGAPNEDVASISGTFTGTGELKKVNIS